MLTSRAEQASVGLSEVRDPREVVLPKKTDPGVGAPKEETVRSRRRRKGPGRDEVGPSRRKERLIV